MPAACSRASRTVGAAVTVGRAMPAGPIRRAGGTAAHAEGPRVVAGRRDRPQVTGGAWVNGRGACRAPARGGAPRPGVRLARAAGPEVGEDLVDHRRLGDERDEPHRAVAGRAHQRVHLKDLLEERRPPAGGLCRRQPRCGNHRRRPVRRCGRRLPPRAPWAIGIPAIVPRGDVALVRNVHQDPGQELQRVHRLGARRGPLRLV